MSTLYSPPTKRRSIRSPAPTTFTSLPDPRVDLVDAEGVVVLANLTPDDAGRMAAIGNGIAPPLAPFAGPLTVRSRPAWRDLTQVRSAPLTP